MTITAWGLTPYALGSPPAFRDRRADDDLSDLVDQTTRLVVCFRDASDEASADDTVTVAGALSAPVVTITSISTSRVSRVPECDAAFVSFTSDQPMIAWRVRAHSTSHVDGSLLASWSGQPMIYGLAEVDSDGLKIGDNEVSVYAQSIQRLWSLRQDDELG